MIKDEIILKDNYRSIAGCYCCKKETHEIRDCPILHYIPDKDFIIRKNNYSVDQKRENYKRRQKKRLNALMANAEIEQKIISLPTSLYLEYISQVPLLESNDDFDEEPNSAGIPTRKLSAINESEDKLSQENSRSDFDEPEKINIIKPFKVIYNKRTPSQTDFPEAEVELLPLKV